LAVASGANSGSGNAVAEVIFAAQSLAESVGPEWGLAILVAIFLFLPKYGVVVNLAQLWKEDRADDRKRKIDSERLMAKYRNRPKISPPPRQLGHEKEKP
jgi:hypothetical protein